MTVTQQDAGDGDGGRSIYRRRRKLFVAALVMHTPAHNRQGATEIGSTWCNLSHVSGLQACNQPPRFVYAQVSQGTVQAPAAAFVSADYFACLPQGPRRQSKKGRLSVFDPMVSHLSAFPPVIRDLPQEGAGRPRRRVRFTFWGESYSRRADCGLPTILKTACRSLGIDLDQ